MDDRQRIQVGSKFLEMYDSLHQAVQNAGGSGASFASEHLDSITVMELFGTLAINNVRFYCTNTYFLSKHPKSTVDPRHTSRQLGHSKNT